MPRAIEKHLAAIQSGTVGKTNIIGLRKAYNVISRDSRYRSVTEPKVTFEELDDALQLIAVHKPRADAALFESGKVRLTDRRYAKRWTESQRRVIETLSHFTLEGFDEFNRSAIPVWRAHGSCGASFRFINPSWQSGGDGPEVLP
jgi:hypothetical protein